VHLIDLASRLDDNEVRSLVASAFGSPEAAQGALRRYRSGEWSVLGFEDEGKVIGLVGLEQASSTTTRVRGLAVSSGLRGQGIGRLLIDEARARMPSMTFYAETDADAVDFYRRCGFEVASRGERYPGVERFRCTLKA
jgi:ribosomal protein S18 acetylase RimI-like enzyme